LYEYFELQPPEQLVHEKGAKYIGANIHYGLFQHQHKVLLQTLSILQSEKPSVMLHMPTGSGKTRTAMHLISHLFNQRTETVIIWLVSGIELCEQASFEFQKAWSHLGTRPLPLMCLWGSRNGINDNSFKEIYDAPSITQSLTDNGWPTEFKDGMIVASLDTIAKEVHRWQPGEMVQKTKKISLIVFDEAHRSLAETYKNSVDILRNQNAPLLGLSATPGRRLHGAEADYTLSNLFENQKVILEIPGYRSPVEGLIAQGYLANIDKEKLEIINPKSDIAIIQQVRSELANNLDISEKALQYFGLNATRNLQIIDRIEKLIKNEDHTRIIVFAASVASSNLLANLLKSRINSIFSTSITNETKLHIREEALAQFKTKDDQVAVLFNFGVLTTGFDVPATSAVIIARPTRSIVLLSQMAGRALRGPKVGGNAIAKLITVVDTAIPELVDTVSQFHAFDNEWQNIGEHL